MGVASLILGILSLVILVFLIGFQWLGVILGLIGVVLGALGRKNPESKGIATAGLVCSIIGLVLCIIVFIGCAGCNIGCAALTKSALS